MNKEIEVPTIEGVKETPAVEEQTETRDMDFTGLLLAVEDTPVGQLTHLINSIQMKDIEYVEFRGIRAPKFPLPLYNYVFNIQGDTAKQIAELPKDVLDQMKKDMAEIEEIGLNVLSKNKVELLASNIDRYGYLDDENHYVGKVKKIVYSFLQLALRMARGDQLACLLNEDFVINPEEVDGD